MVCATLATGTLFTFNNTSPIRIPARTDGLTAPPAPAAPPAPPPLAPAPLPPPPALMPLCLGLRNPPMTTAPCSSRRKSPKPKSQTGSTAVYSLPGASESAEEDPGASAGGGGGRGSMGGGEEVCGTDEAAAAVLMGAGTTRLARGERGALAGLLSELRRRELGRLLPESEPAEAPRPWFSFRCAWGVW